MHGTKIEAAKQDEEWHHKITKGSFLLSGLPGKRANSKIDPGDADLTLGASLVCAVYVKSNKP